MREFNALQFTGDGQAMEQPPEGQQVCEGEDPDGVWEGGQGGHVPLPRHLLHVQHALLDLLPDCRQHAGF